MLFVPALVLYLGLATASIALAAEDTDSIEDILEVLSDRGLIDEATHAKILTKHNTRQASARGDVAASVLGGWQFAGDLRLRWESFIYDDDATGVEATNRYRLRYRGRLSARKQLNDWLRIGFRIASGSSSPRSANQTLGRGDDFDTDDLRLDKAWAALTPNLGDDTELEIVEGKMTNPYRWKAGKDFLVWDTDLTLEGAQLLATHRLSERAKLFSHAGYYIAAQNTSSSDPKLLAVQGARSSLRSRTPRWDCAAPATSGTRSTPAETRTTRASSSAGRVSATCRTPSTAPSCASGPRRPT